MGYMMAHGDCFRCGRFFSFNPHLVPSIPLARNAEGQFVPTPGGERHPICRACVEQVNPIRKASGLFEIQILPGAYEPAEE
jgi:hypothetical protein